MYRDKAFQTQMIKHFSPFPPPAQGEILIMKEKERAIIHHRVISPLRPRKDLGETGFKGVK